MGLEMAEFMMDIEDKFQVSIGDNVDIGDGMLGSVLEGVAKQIEPQLGNGFDKDELWRFMVLDLHERFKIPLDSIAKDSHIYRDLNLG